MTLEAQMKERLTEYWAFLNELSTKGVVSEVDAEKLQRLAAFLTPVEAGVENEEAVGLNRWSVRDWARRPRQTGMEQQNEKVVLDLINLFAWFEIPFYIRDKRGEKTGREYSTLQRLSMLKEKFKDIGAAAQNANKRADVATALIEKHRLAHAAVLAELWDASYAAVARARVILQNVEEPMETVKYGDPDDRGVRKVTLDARALVLRLCMQRIVHDLSPDEAICKTCLGLGLIKCSSDYGLGDRKPNEKAFPYLHQWLRDCPSCYMGVAKLCPLCRAEIPRQCTACECTAAKAARELAGHEKEMERQGKLPRVSLEAYKQPMVWCDECGEYVSVDSIDEHMGGCFDDADDRPRRSRLQQFFACEPSAPLTKPEADDIIEALYESSMAEVDPEDGEAVLNIAKEGAAELDAFLEEWAKKHVTARDLYYPNMKLIVEVVRGESDDIPV